MNNTISKEISVTGIVQGVGFRPHVFNLARSLNLRGTVHNSGRGVQIAVEGREDRVEQFINALQSNPPFLARIDGFHVFTRPLRGFAAFTIAATGGSATGESVVPPDSATCPDCGREIRDPADRHYRYPLTNCTRCGPRFTIVQGLPYDRPLTSMAGFKMCPACAAEYRDPADRRFHAQPVACPECGPRVWLADKYDNILEGDWLVLTRRLLTEGKILALKSLGGFHLACNAGDPIAVMRLRRRKGRPAKPLAIMCRDLAAAHEFCHISPAEKALLCSPAAPVVALTKKDTCTLPVQLAPGLDTLGIMLPYTPLHILLMAEGPPVLVMTSGNRSGLPLAADNRRARVELDGIADCFLFHNRNIVNRCDDSVVQVVVDEVHFLRRSRGYVPASMPVPGGAHGECVYLGAGGDMKNTFCLVKSGQAYVSQHTGALDTRQGMDNYKECLENLCRLLCFKPGVVGYDPHPGYNVSGLARTLAPVATAVWHHHAHMASCMAENRLDEKVIGIILDGTGYGPDGTIWGFEVLHGDYINFTREFHLEHMPLPGGERAVRNPWITACAWLAARLGDGGINLARQLFPERAYEIKLLDRMIKQGINSPPVSSCGRLFDAVAALLGVCTENTYDGQAAVELGALVSKTNRVPGKTYPVVLNKKFIHTGELLEELLDDIQNNIRPAAIAQKFHDTVIAIVKSTAIRVRKDTGTNKVVLSGGSWHNRYLLQRTVESLRQQGFKVYFHRLVPPGDGGIALGQAMVAMKKHEQGG